MFQSSQPAFESYDNETFSDVPSYNPSFVASFPMHLNPFTSQAEYSESSTSYPSKVLFELKDDPRISAGFESLSLLERVYQQACHFADVQSQSETSHSKKIMGYSLMENPNTQRILLTMQSFIEVSRSILYQTSLTLKAYDMALSDDNHPLQTSLHFLLPIANGWIGNKSAEMIQSAFQIFSNMGYAPDYEMAEFYFKTSSKALYDSTPMLHASNLVLKAIPLNEGDGFRPFFHSMETVSTKCMTDISQDDLYTVGEYLDMAKDDFLQSAEWMLQKSGFLGQQEEALGGATPFLELFGLSLGGLHLSQQALFAFEQLSSGDLTPDMKQDYQNRIDMARFYNENLLSHVKPLSIACTRGTSSLKAFNPSLMSMG